MSQEEHTGAPRRIGSSNCLNFLFNPNSLHDHFRDLAQLFSYQNYFAAFIVPFCAGTPGSRPDQKYSGRNRILRYEEVVALSRPSYTRLVSYNFFLMASFVQRWTFYYFSRPFLFSLIGVKCGLTYIQMTSDFIVSDCFMILCGFGVTIYQVNPVLN